MRRLATCALASVLLLFGLPGLDHATQLLVADGFEGEIDEVRFYTYPLSEEEVKRLFQSETLR